MDNIEKYVIESGDEIGRNLDQQKISIYEWKDKIEKVTKKNESFKKSKNKSIKQEVKGILPPRTNIYNVYRAKWRFS